MDFKNIAIHKRQVVYFINDVEYNGLRYCDEGKELLRSENVCIVSLEDSQNFCNTFTIFDDAYPTDGLMLIVAPYDTNTYVQIESCTEHFAIDKIDKIMKVCQLLGAREVRINNIYEEKDTQTTDIEIKGESAVSYISGQAKGSYEAIDKLKKQIGRITKFSASEPAFDKAQNYLKKYKLTGDSFLKNLVEMFDPDFMINKLTYSEHRVSLTTSNSKKFDFLLSLKFPAGDGSFKINTQSVSEKKYVLDIEIFF